MIKRDLVQLMEPLIDHAEVCTVNSNGEIVLAKARLVRQNSRSIRIIVLVEPTQQKPID